MFCRKSRGHVLLTLAKQHFLQTRPPTAFPQLKHQAKVHVSDASALEALSLERYSNRSHQIVQSADNMFLKDLTLSRMALKLRLLYNQVPNSSIDVDPVFPLSVPNLAKRWPRSVPKLAPQPYCRTS